MSLLSRLFKPRGGDRDALRPLWHGVVAAARARRWFADYGVADSLAGRFDMITAVLALVLLRMESEPDLVGPSVRLTELFVEDMDGQLREAGVGDVVVGKHIGRLMSVLGGRLGAYRAALAGSDSDALREAVARNITLSGERARAGDLAAALAEYSRELARLPSDILLTGELPR